jgi:selenoprotein W-related protein
VAEKPSLAIEYCTACNFRGRASWLAQEVLAAHEADLAAVTLVPGRGGIFEVRLAGELLFSNKEMGRFPEPGEVKDAIRDRLGQGPPTRHSGRDS